VEVVCSVANGSQNLDESTGTLNWEQKLYCVTVVHERPPRDPVQDGFINVRISSGWRRREGDVRDEGGGGAELSGLMWAAVRLELGFQVCRGRMTSVTSSEYRGCSGEGLARQWAVGWLAGGKRGWLGGTETERRRAGRWARK
jgi:hypothetical protein